MSLTGVERIKAERQRQIEELSLHASHDEQWIEGELAGAAACYAVTASRQIGSGYYQAEAVKPPGQTWRWSGEWWKPSTDPIRNLEKAGALIAAEIDRLLAEGAT